MKVVLITDTHFGARNDNRIFQNYFNRFYHDIFFPELFKREIKTVIHLGDLVDRRRTINFVTLDEMKNNFINVLVENNIDTHIIIGNHDAYYKNTNQINSVNQLISSYVPHINVYDTSTTVSIGEYELCFIPWICADNAKETFKHIKKTKAQLAFGHLNINGYPMFKGRLSDHGYERKDFDKFDMVFSGHFHTKINDDKVYYLGAPYQMNWNDFDDQKGFHILDLETREIEFIKNPYAMFHKLYYEENSKEKNFSQYEESYLKVIVEEQNNPVKFQKYMDKLYKANPADLKIIQDVSEYSSDDVIDETEDTLTVLENYVNDLELDCDKKKLNSIFSELYSEALSVE